MDWRRGNTMYYVTSQEGYRIAKTFHGPGREVKYSAFSPSSKDCDLGVHSTYEDAKGVCEDHVNQ